MEKISQILADGGVILYPTETIYGLGCDPLNKKAVARISSIKGRDDKKPFLILCNSLEEVEEFFDLEQDEYTFLAEAWPAPLTALLQPSSKLLKHLKGPSGKIGVRVSDHPWIKECFQAWPGMLLSTSANLSGQTYIGNPEILAKIFKDQVDQLCWGDSNHSLPSTVAEYKEGEWVVLREGAFTNF
jgi:L-threonylcarbamoyladenylate synthase